MKMFFVYFLISTQTANKLTKQIREGLALIREVSFSRFSPFCFLSLSWLITWNKRSLTDTDKYRYRRTTTAAENQVGWGNSLVVVLVDYRKYQVNIMNVTVWHVWSVRWWCDTDDDGGTGVDDGGSGEPSQTKPKSSLLWSSGNNNYIPEVEKMLLLCVQSKRG